MFLLCILDNSTNEDTGKEKAKLIINRAQRLVATTLFSTSNKDEEKRVFDNIFKEIF
jgi:hypothetical protein